MSAGALAVAAAGAVLEAGCTLGVGAVVGERAHIGAGAQVGEGAVVAAGVRVGAGARICAGAVVTRDVPVRAVVQAGISTITGYVDTPERLLRAQSAARSRQRAGKRSAWRAALPPARSAGYAR